MPRTPKNPSFERVAHVPFEKDDISPMRQTVPRARESSARGRAEPGQVTGPATAPPPAGEEYPGPQTSSSGTRVEPGRPRPTKARDR